MLPTDAALSAGAVLDEAVRFEGMSARVISILRHKQMRGHKTENAPSKSSSSPARAASPVLANVGAGATKPWAVQRIERRAIAEKDFMVA